MFNKDNENKCILLLVFSIYLFSNVAHSDQATKLFVTFILAQTAIMCKSHKCKMTVTFIVISNATETIAQDVNCNIVYSLKL